MSIFNLIANIFKKTTSLPKKSDHLWREGYEAFERGKNLYFQNEILQALHNFDTAIDSGFEGADVYSMRGGCLQTLQYDLDAIDDFTKAIEFDPEDSNYYYMRSISKGAVGDLHGGIEDLKEAIRLAGIDSASTRSHNAGIQRRAPLEDFAAETWREVMRTNLDSVFFVAQAVARHMIPRKQGKIINICSVQSQLGRPSIAPYAASKGAVKMLTQGMCADWAKHGLQTNGIAPGYFATPMNQALVDDPAFSDWLCKRTPAGRWGRVEELGGAAVFLASAASSFVNGQIIYVDGGMTSVV